jgi:hypothetical protein
MTRFKELRRIELAIKNKDNKELLWALSYCKMRLKLATMKQHIKHWQKLIDELNDIVTPENQE